MPGKDRQQSVERHLQRLRVLGGIASEITAELDLPKVLDTVVKRGLELSELDEGGVVLHDAATGEWIPEVAVGYEQPFPRTPIPLGMGVTGEVIAHRRIVAIEDYQNFPRAIPRFLELGVRSVIGTPIVFQGRLIGVLVLETRRPGRVFSEEDRELVTMLAAHAAIAIENARLYASVVESNRELERRVSERTAELELAGRQKDRFLAMLGHELRNPLAAAKSAADVLRQRTEGHLCSTSAEALDVLERQLSSQVQIVDDLLDVSRITQGRIVLHPVDVELTGLCRRALADHRDAGARAGVQLSLSSPEEPLWTRGDPVRLTQILGNLLGNAIKFTDRGGVVRVSLRASDASHVVLSVKDTGLGIEPALVPRLFQTFSQGLHEGERSAGLGLGLALVKHLAQLHGGDVSADSRGPGQGAEFTLTLPRIPAPAHRTTPARPLPAEPTGRARRLLVVDDNRDVARMLAEVLRMRGHDVAIAYSGDEGLATFRTFAPEAVICDLSLPGMDGHQVAAALRREACPSLVLVALTGFGGQAESRRSREAGFDLHFVKPVEPDELLRAIEARVASR